MATLSDATITVKPWPAAGEARQPRARTDVLAERSYFRWRVPVERVIAGFLLMVGLPMILILGILVRMTSSGPAIYRQMRVGMHGKRFRMYKLRTMREDAEVHSGPVWARSRDPRITRLGKFLRRLHLDELPQLFNVIRGEMSLVGPRPERPEFVTVLSDAIPGYLDRLAAPPGVTGLAQINLPPDTDLNSVRRKLILDRVYIETAGPFLDLRIFSCTLLRMLRVPERLAGRLFAVQREVQLPACEVDALTCEALDTTHADVVRACALAHVPIPMGRNGRHGHQRLYSHWKPR